MKNNLETVRRMAVTLPGAEEGTSYGTPAFRAKKKLFARLHQDGESLVLRTDPEMRDILLTTRPDFFYITDHYRNYPYVLAKLSVIGSEELENAIVHAWQCCATKALIAEYQNHVRDRENGR